MRGEYGFYDSVDFTKERLGQHKSYEPVKTYMAHHQGLIINSINNIVNKDILKRRFMSNPEIKAVEILLNERMPESVVLSKEKTKKMPKGKYVNKYDDREIIYTKENDFKRINAISSEDKELCTGLSCFGDAAQTMAAVSELIIQNDKEGIAKDAVSIVVPDASVYVPLEELIDFEQEIERLAKEENRLTKEIARAEGMLNNERFVSKAPKSKVQEEKEKLETYRQMMAEVQDRLNGLKAR